MPELPEVETMRRGILEIECATITGAIRVPCKKKPIAITPRIDWFDRRTRNKTIVRIERIGKRVVLELNDAQRIVFEPRMTGLVLTGRPPSLEYLRFALQLRKGRRRKTLRFWDRRGLGSVALLRESEFRQRFADERIGPDALNLGLEAWRIRLGSSQREIKVALLDQRAIAGIGNLYASEILHRAKIHPQARCHRLHAADWDSIYHSTQFVLRSAIQFEGSTLSDGTYRNALNEPGGYQNHHRVYDRADEVCGTCGRAKIVRIVQAQRSTFLCPSCQRLTKQAK